MITLKEYFGHTNANDAGMTNVRNAEELLAKVNLLNDAWVNAGHSEFKMTSGFRSIQDQLRIYRSKDVPDAKVPMKSQHLSGEAIDIYDADLSLTKWLKENDSERLKAVGLYCEEGNANWVHFQLRPPKSGKRWFLP